MLLNMIIYPTNPKNCSTDAGISFRCYAMSLALLAISVLTV